MLQKYFRMWLAQAHLIRMQLDAIGKSTDTADRIVFPHQSDEVRPLPLLTDYYNARLV